MNQILITLQDYVIKIGISLLIIIVGFIIVKKFQKLIDKVLNRTKLDDTIKPFLSSLIYNLLRVLVVVYALENVMDGGASLAAILASAGLAIGLAFQGTLSNFAGGVLILILRPFKVGDFVELNGHAGTVESVQIFNTTLVTVDNRVIIIPNSTVSNTDIINYSIKDKRRVDLKFGVGYEEDIERVKNVLGEIVNAHNLILNDPEPLIRVSEHGDSAIFFVVRVWVKSPDYWTVQYDLLENVKKRFDEEGISIPYPQMDIHSK